MQTVARLADAADKAVGTDWFDYNNGSEWMAGYGHSDTEYDTSGSVTAITRKCYLGVRNT